ncbi:MAG TPA: hypothetical protein VD793_12095 [Gemmatimonadales bacterium]|nr:hypothetical protein [Gemmatimonadales bacterium]
MSRIPARARGKGLAGAQLIGLLAVGACTAASVRPTLRPLPGARVDTIPGQPDSVVHRLTAALEAEGLEVRLRSPVEGYVETAWFDLAARRSRAPEHLASERVVKVRVWADPLPPAETIVILEAVHRTETDPSQPGRELEAVVPPGHPADSLVQRLLALLEPRP